MSLRRTLLKFRTRPGKSLSLLAVCSLFFVTLLKVSQYRSSKSDVNPKSIRADYRADLVTYGQSKMYPNEWVPGSRDKYFNMTLAGLPDSPGQNGAAVKHSEESKRRAEETFHLHRFDVVACNMVPLDRSVKDLRHQECFAVQYDKDLPATSVVIIFHNEAPCTLLRTVISILIRTEPRYLKEIILMDDCSTRDEIKRLLPLFVKEYLPSKVKLTRSRKRLGLIRARMAGSDQATGDVILFLDSHCEVGPGWLEPMLQPIKDDHRNVVIPAHDNIAKDSFEFQGSTSVDSQGTFNWGLVHEWQFVAQRDRLAIKTKADPVRSPTMAGGLFAISRRWWEHLGKYDPGFEVWGGENLEISFKIWMCGGRLDTIPCSHVGHVFRNCCPYNKTVDNSMAINRKRLAEVWLDDKYKELVYFANPDMKDADEGDISDRVQLRKYLQCKNFDWFMKNVVPEKYVPSIKDVARGGLRNLDTKHCLDTMGNKEGKVFMFGCHLQGGNQDFQYSANHEIRRNLDLCLGADFSNLDVSLQKCGGEVTQKWDHAGPQSVIMPRERHDLCLSTKSVPDQGLVLCLRRCDTPLPDKLWSFIKYIDNE